MSHHVEMDRTERFYKIELALRSQPVVTFDALLALLEVSRATLKRDLQYLRDRMNAPIEYDRELGGYRLPAATGGGAGARHELPGVWFSEAEIHALLSMHALMSGLDEEGVLARHLQPFMDKLEGMLGSNDAEAREFMKSVKVITVARRRSAGAYFELIAGALLHRQQLQLSYFKRSERKQSERVVSPQRLVNHRSTWYLDAFCHEANGLRRFALDAILNASCLKSRAKRVKLSEIEAAFDRGYGIYGGAGQALKWAVLHFSAEAAQWVSNEEWHPNQQAQTLPDGRYELRVPYTDATELVMDILRHGDAVKVVGDADLARQVRTRLKAAAALYA